MSDKATIPSAEGILAEAIEDLRRMAQPPNCAHALGAACTLLEYARQQISEKQ
jgi:cysteine sulfinate desulfinase/cysteine desulfurase-like protein